MARLEDITGKALSGEWGNDDLDGTGIPVLRTTNFTNDGIVNYENVVTRCISQKDLSQKYLRYGDIIIEKSGGSDKQPVGRVVFFEDDANKYLFNNFTGVLRVRDATVWFPKYIFYSMYANYQKGGTRRYENKTTGLHNLKTDQYVSSFQVNSRSLTEQKHIVNQLDKVSDLIALRKQQLAKLDELVKSRFVELFGDKRYPEDSLLKLCNIIDYRGKTPEKVESGLPFITAKNVRMHQMNLEPREYISKETYDKVMVRGFPKEGDVVFTTEAPLGNVCRIPHFDTEFYIGQEYCKTEDKEVARKFWHDNFTQKRFIKLINDYKKDSDGILENYLNTVYRELSAFTHNNFWHSFSKAYIPTEDGSGVKANLFGEHVRRAEQILQQLICDAWPLHLLFTLVFPVAFTIGRCITQHLIPRTDHAIIIPVLWTSWTPTLRSCATWALRSTSRSTATLMPTSPLSVVCFAQDYGR